jgi:hypothetical protein
MHIPHEIVIIQRGAGMGHHAYGKEQISVVKLEHLCGNRSYRVGIAEKRLFVPNPGFSVVPAAENVIPAWRDHIGAVTDHYEQFTVSSPGNAGGVDRTSAVDQMFGYDCLLNDIHFDVLCRKAKCGSSAEQGEQLFFHNSFSFSVVGN